MNRVVNGCSGVAKGKVGHVLKRGLWLLEKMMVEFSSD